MLVHDGVDLRVERSDRQLASGCRAADAAGEPPLSREPVEGLDPPIGRVVAPHGERDDRRVRQELGTDVDERVERDVRGVVLRPDVDHPGVLEAGEDPWGEDRYREAGQPGAPGPPERASQREPGPCPTLPADQRPPRRHRAHGLPEEQAEGADDEGDHVERAGPVSDDQAAEGEEGTWRQQRTRVTAARDELERIADDLSTSLF